MTTRPDKIDTPCLAWMEKQDEWQMIHDLMGGTKAMRLAGEIWLPKEPLETVPAYNNRIKRSFLFAAYADTVMKIVSQPFADDVAIRGTVPDRISSMEQNVDGVGRNITQFMREVFEAGVKYGRTHVLVDFPTMSTNSTLADTVGSTPVFVHITAPMLIGWRTEIRNSVEVLTQVRIKEVRTEVVGNYADAQVEYIRVYNEKAWELWRKTPSDPEFTKTANGDHTFGSVPLFTFYTKRTGFMTSDMPMEDLAWMNIAHWQSSSDQRNILRFARVGLLFAAGFSQEEVDKGIEIGPKSLIATSNPNAKLEVVEHKGIALSAGRDDIKDIEERMVILGMQPHLQIRQNVTATGQNIDDLKTHSLIHSWVRGLENFGEIIFGAAATWVGAVLSSDFEADINTEFGPSLHDSADIDALIKMRMAGEISRRTFLEEVKRRTLLADTVNIDAEVEAIQSEGPALGLIGTDVPPIPGG